MARGAFAHLFDSWLDEQARAIVGELMGDEAGPRLMDGLEVDSVSRKGAGMGRITVENCGEVVRYHAPTPEQVVAHEALAVAAEGFLRAILENCPDSADRNAAIRLVREAKMTGSASIALEGRV